MQTRVKWVVNVTAAILCRNDGAKHKGPWSRLDVQKNPAGFGRFALSALTAKLPPQANTFYFRDEIGNISTSNIRSAAVATTGNVCVRCTSSFEQLANESLSCQAKHSRQGLLSFVSVVSCLECPLLLMQTLCWLKK
jgi:hypothetical protein